MSNKKKPSEPIHAKAYIGGRKWIADVPLIGGIAQLVVETSATSAVDKAFTTSGEIPQGSRDLVKADIAKLGNGDLIALRKGVWSPSDLGIERHGIDEAKFPGVVESYIEAVLEDRKHRRTWIQVGINAGSALVGAFIGGILS